MDGFYAGNGVFANRNPAMIFSDYVSKGDSIDEGTEYCEDCGKKEGNLERTNEATSNDCCCTGVDATDICLFEMEKT